MKRYQFSLQAVLQLRRSEQERAAHDLALASTALSAALLRRESAKARYLAASEQSALRNVADLLGQVSWSRVLASSLLKAEQDVSVAAAEAARRRIAWIAAQRKVRSLERLDERRFAEWQAEASASERAELDELAQAAFVRRGLEGQAS